MLIYTHNFTFQEPTAHKVDNKNELLSQHDETDLFTDRMVLWYILQNGELITISKESEIHSDFSKN